MKKWLRENRLKIGLVTVMFALIAAAFYWYELRPTFARENCGAHAKQRGNDEWHKQPFDSVLEAERFYNLSYEVCMHERGY